MKNVIALTLSLALSASAFAHTDEMLDGIEGAHGGVLRMAGPYHYELVLKADSLNVYVTDHAGTPSAIAGATGTATVLSGKTKQSVVLKPAGENQLSGAGTFDPKARTKAVVSVNFPGQGALEARFDLNKPKGEGHEEAAHAH